SHAAARGAAGDRGVPEARAGPSRRFHGLLPPREGVPVRGEGGRRGRAARTQGGGARSELRPREKAPERAPVSRRLAAHSIALTSSRSSAAAGSFGARRRNSFSS